MVIRTCSHRSLLPLIPAVLAALASCAAAPEARRATVADLDDALEDWTEALDAQAALCGGLYGTSFEAAMREFASPDLEGHQPNRDFWTAVRDLDQPSAVEPESESRSRHSFRPSIETIQMSPEFSQQLEELATASQWDPGQLPEQPDPGWVEAVDTRRVALRALISGVETSAADTRHVSVAVAVSPPPPLLTDASVPLELQTQVRERSRSMIAEQHERMIGGSDSAPATAESLSVAARAVSHLAESGRFELRELQSARDDARVQLMAIRSANPRHASGLMAHIDYWTYAAADGALAGALLALEIAPARHDELAKTWAEWAPEAVAVEDTWFLRSPPKAFGRRLYVGTPTPRTVAAQTWKDTLRDAVNTMGRIKSEQRTIDPRERWRARVDAQMKAYRRLIQAAEATVLAVEADRKSRETVDPQARHREFLIAKKRYDVLQEAVEWTLVRLNAR